jgi:hypothetical protein
MLGPKVCAVVVWVVGAGAVGPTFEPDRERRRIESIEMNGAGDAGVVRTVPEVLGEPASAFHFGAPHCKGRTLGAATLEQLHVALRTRQLVTIEATQTGEGERAVSCIATVKFWAPEG